MPVSARREHGAGLGAQEGDPRGGEGASQQRGEDRGAGGRAAALGTWWPYGVHRWGRAGTSRQGPGSALGGKGKNAVQGGAAPLPSREEKRRELEQPREGWMQVCFSHPGFCL